MKKIHFINRIDWDNAGDWGCCPLNYYLDYFEQFNVTLQEFPHPLQVVG